MPHSVCRLRLLCRVGLVVLAALPGLAQPAATWAGGGPENLLLVVNSRSWASLAVANHYQQLRGIPPGNVVYLDYGDSVERIAVETFREQLLKPILSAIEERRLGDHIDYIVYSSDFPWSIDGRKDTAQVELPRFLSPVGSLNGFTYLAPLVAAGNPNYVQLNANRYFRPGPRHAVPESHGFRSWYGWSAEGQLLEAGGERYLLSTMLAVTSGRGTSVEQAIDYLARAATADGTSPTGTIYYCQNSDVRSATRQGGFQPAVEALQALGVKATVVESVLPTAVRDVQGAMVGIASFSWKSSGSEILPGAICEHLTSTGGVMSSRAGQTPLTEFLTNGAAGASGAVIEPFAIQEKFPTPAIHVHYARGCSLAEAFYQSVHGPYQLLILGDPLCRPWARLPAVVIDTPRPGDSVSGMLNLQPRNDNDQVEVDRFELYVDGLLVGQVPPGATLALDTSRLPDGYHELRVVGVEAGPIESRHGAILPVDSRNHQRTIQLSTSAGATVDWNQPLELTVDAPGAAGVAILHNSRVLARVQGGAGTVSIDPKTLGLGPVALRAVALAAEGSANRAADSAVSAPLELEITPGKPLPASANGNLATAPGLELVLEDGRRVPITDSSPEAWLEVAGVEPGHVFSLVGFVVARETGLHQFQLRHAGQLELKLGDTRLYRADHLQPTRAFVPVNLAAGRHRLTITGVAPLPVRLELQFGHRGAAPVNEHTFQHLLRP